MAEPAEHLEDLGEQYVDREQQRTAYELGMWTFLGSEVMLFGGLFLAYLFARVAGGAGFSAASGQTNLLLGSLNTGLLLTSSYSMALAVGAGRQADRRRALGWLAVTAVLGLGFLGIKGLEWYQEFQEGLVPGWHWTWHGEQARGAMLFFWLYFTMTGLHALHLLAAVGAVGGTLVLLLRSEAGRHGSILEITGLYWHLVDGIWIFLFPLLYLLGRHG